MKVTILKALMLPIALLALGGINQASASVCAASYTMAAVSVAGFSCTLDLLTFSNFDVTYQTGNDAGCGSHCTAPSTPNSTSDITVNFAEETSGSDPYLTAAAVNMPIFSVIVDYSAGNAVTEFQNETSVVQFLVTDPGGTVITEVDGAITGSAVHSASGELDANICANNAFGPNGSCTSDQSYVTSGLGLSSVSGPAGTQSDGTTDFLQPPITFPLTVMGVSDSWSLDGGNRSTNAANITSFENDFIDPIPEPATIILVGGALVGLGLIRRRRKVA
jgi:hypothetical protein